MPNDRLSAAERLEAQLRGLKTTLRKPNELAEDIRLPTDLSVAFATGRPELLKLAKPRALNESEAAALYHAVGVLMETNRALAEHAETVGHLANDLHTHFKGFTGGLLRLSNFANFAAADGEEDTD